MPSLGSQQCLGRAACGSLDIAHWRRGVGRGQVARRSMSWTAERVFFATGKYVDAVERINGQWKIVHRNEPITSCALLDAFPVG
jgi:hypothetical protein